MIMARAAALVLAAGFCFGSVAFAGGGAAAVNEALAKAAQSGKPLLAIAGSEN